MRTATSIMQWIVRIAGITLIVLGTLFWLGRALSLIPVHMAVGLVLVLAMLALAGIAARAGVRGGLVALTVIWALVVLVLGVTQMRILPGSAHWVVRVLHLLVGLGALRLAEVVANAVRGRAEQGPAGMVRERAGAA
ncbi:MAG TPA: hypothetical protein VF041_05590 [Gemmatimonadaceae bacterium]